MKNVVFDLLSSQPAGGVKFHGGGEYIKSVFRSFLCSSNVEEGVYACFDSSKYIDNWILDTKKNDRVVFKDVKNIHDIVSFLEKFDNDCTICFFAGLIYSYRDVTFPENVISIGTCHGIRAIEKPKDKYQLKYLSFRENGLKSMFVETANIVFDDTLKKRHNWTYSSSISRFDTIITDSLHSLYSLRLNYGNVIEGKRMLVLYPMTQDIPTESMLDRASDGGYIMLISANRWIKNSYRACEAIDDLYTKGELKGIRTKIFGNLPRRIRKKVINPDMFDFYDYVEFDELERAYAGCTVFFYPTLNEGFGNVPMEAMKYGKTCVVSAVCSLPEVYGESVIYCNPYDIMEMQNRILQAVDRRIDINIIERRLDYLYNRQRKDMQILCSLIRGEDVGGL